MTSSKGQRHFVRVERRLVVFPSSVCSEALKREESRAFSFGPREHSERKHRNSSKSDALYVDPLLSNVVLCEAVTANALNPCNNAKYRKMRSLPRTSRKEATACLSSCEGSLESRHRRLCYSERSRVDIRCAQAPGRGRNDGDGYTINGEFCVRDFGWTPPRGLPPAPEPADVVNSRWNPSNSADVPDSTGSH